jgi:ABC-type polysaccharide/polyol phosphate export permease
VAHKPPATLHRGERVLAAMVATVLGLSVVAILISLVVSGTGGTPWPIVLVLPLVGLPIGFLFMIALLLVSVIRRTRESRDA